MQPFSQGTVLEQEEHSRTFFSNKKNAALAAEAGSLVPRPAQDRLLREDVQQLSQGSKSCDLF